MNRELRAKLIKRITAITATPFNGDGLILLLKDIRMLLEELGETDRYPILKLHCDWVLHAVLCGSKVRKLLKEFDEVWDAWIVRKISIPEDFANKLPYTVGMYGFEQELSNFLKRYQINNTLARDQWQPFELLYCNIVKDCSLQYTDKKHPLKHIDGARIRMYEVAKHPEERKTYRPGDYLPFGIEWTFTKGNEPVWQLTATCPSSSLLERENVKRF